MYPSGADNVSATLDNMATLDNVFATLDMDRSPRNAYPTTTTNTAMATVQQYLSAGKQKPVVMNKYVSGFLFVTLNMYKLVFYGDF